MLSVPPHAPASPRVLAWRARYYALRNARRSIARGDYVAARQFLAGPHGIYVRDGLERLARSDDRVRTFTDGLEPRTRETLPPSNQDASSRARRVAEGLEDRLRFVGVAGYWPTSHTVAARAVQLAALSAGERVLEPSAGSGRLIEATLAADPLTNVDACEIAIPAREVLVVKQQYLRFTLAGSDFFHFPASPCYDAILMHPPFIGAAGHVAKAWSHHLRAGGRLVAILADTSIYAGDSEAQRLRAIVEGHADDAEGELVAGGIGDAPTWAGRLYVLRKPTT
jgi:protein-L-isoaspartate O-methyltransferase